jgi:hypothetical protein
MAPTHHEGIHHTASAGGKHVSRKTMHTSISTLRETESWVGCYAGPVSAQPHITSRVKSMLINEV